MAQIPGGAKIAGERRIDLDTGHRAETMLFGRK